MSIDSNRVKQISALLVFVLVIGIFTFNAGQAETKKDTKITQEAKVNETKNSETKNKKVCLVAGATGAVIDADEQVSVSEDSKVLVASSSDDKMSVSEACGYTNLAVANISEGNLNIRKEPSTESEIAGVLTKHNACEVLGTEGEWTSIKSGKVTGYVMSSYLLFGDDAEQIAEEEVMTVATVNTETLRVRSQASTESSTLSLVGDSEDLAVTSIEGDWVEVEVDDETGYVSKDYVALSEKLPTAKTITEVKYGTGVSDVRVSLVQYALQFVGNRYVWGGESLTNGVDCSGFTMQIYARYGVYLPHSSKSQPGCGTKINALDAQPGDLFFYGSGKSINHVAIYIGDGQIVHASNARDGIKVSNAYYRTPICVVRYL